MRALQTAVAAATAEGLPLQRTVVVFVSLGEGRLPTAVKTAMTMLDSRVAEVVSMPFEPQIRTGGGVHEAVRPKSRIELTTAVLASAHRSWGEPLPPAAEPAPLRTPIPS
ncbi:hypothetical protein JW592_31230 [Streptomyces sp. DW4-2]|uniref:VWA domain-containing protein n=1 Tax=Streptomyces spirodelae TaxID=2812904 RepID=A0ABS3X3I1_9ACTN|nr:hypothetical protein [Streptomyces spirodelae]